MTLRTIAAVALAAALLGDGTLALAQIKDEPQAVIKTSLGTIVVALDPADAPDTVANFLDYVRDGTYNGTIFHRVIDGFMIQGGGFDASMTEKPMRAPIKNEATNGLKNVTGAIAMAREEGIDTATDEFFINVADNDFLDHRDVPQQGLDFTTRSGKAIHVEPSNAARVYGYAVFGHVVSGMDVVQKIAKLPTKTVGEFENVPVTSVVIESITIQ